MRVLIADTDETFLTKLQSSFSDRGHAAQISADGLQCVAILHDSIPDVLVMDSDLQLWGGCYGVLATMCENRWLAQIPVVIMTSREETGAMTYPNVAARIQKPFPFDDLLETIVFVLRTAQLASSGYEMN